MVLFTKKKTESPTGATEKKMMTAGTPPLRLSSMLTSGMRKVAPAPWPTHSLEFP
jgi:hypothetical protein